MRKPERMSERERKGGPRQPNLFCAISRNNSKVDFFGIKGFGINTALISPHVIQ